MMACAPENFSEGVRAVIKLRKLLFHAICLLTLTACQKAVVPAAINDAMSEMQDMALQQKNGWQLDKRRNEQGEIVPVLTGTTITIVFQPKGELSGQGGCNRYFARYQAGVDTLTIGFIGATLRACEQNLSQQEQEYLAQLETVARWRIVEKQLRLANAQKEDILFFSPVSPLHLSGSSWQLREMRSRQGNRVNVANYKINMRLSGDGKVQGYAGCNRFFGGYHARQEQLVFTRLATTRKFCPVPDSAMSTESRFIDTLNRVRRYTINSDKLLLFDEAGDNILVFTKNH